MPSKRRGPTNGQFLGLPMGELTGGPLMAASEAEAAAAKAQADFVRAVTPPADKAADEAPEA